MIDFNTATSKILIDNRDYFLSYCHHISDELLLTFEQRLTKLGVAISGNSFTAQLIFRRPPRISQENFGLIRIRT